MTLGFGALTLGLMLIYSAFTDTSISDLLLGKESEKSDRNPFDDIAGQVVGGGAGVAKGAISEVNKKASGTTTIDGKPVAKWIAKYVLEARKRGLWHGTVTSGYRSPEYSESLCMGICGAPSCPGQCAGKSSNHSGKKYPAGAVDVTNEDEFAAAMKKLGAPLKNNLPSDRVHFSFTGN